jgi:hypothetical protein
MKDIRFHPGSELSFQKTVYNDAYLFDGDKVNCFCAAPDGRLYVGAGYGLFFFDGEVFVKYVDVLTSVTSVCCAEETVYAASGKNVYILRNDLQIGRLTFEDDVTALYQDADYGIIVETSNRLYSINNDKTEPLQVDLTDHSIVSVPAEHSFVTSYAKSENGAFLLGTRKGLYMFMPGGSYQFGEETLPDGRVNDVFVTADRKEIWVATDRGICRLQFDSAFC